MAIENLSVIEQTLQLPEGTLKQAIESQEVVKIELPELVVLKKEEDSLRIENLKSTFQKQGADFLIKEAKQKFGLEFEGKSIDKFAESLKVKALQEAQINPDSKVKELQSDIEKLRNNLLEKDNLIQNIEQTYKKKEAQTFIDSTLNKAINVETTIPKEDVLQLLKSKFEIDLEENKIIFKKNGEVLKNEKTLSPKTIEEVMTEFLPTYTKQGATGGKGEGNQTGNRNATSMDLFNEEMKNKSINVGSEAYNRELQTRLANKTLKF
jgi:hypothetical protein